MATAPRFLRDTLWSAASSISASSTATGFAASNTQVDYPQVVWRSTGDSDENVTIDHGSASSGHTMVAIVGHNFTSGATIELRESSDNFAASNVLNATLTYRAGVVYGFVSAGNYRYRRIRVQDASNPAGYIQIGRILFGSYFEPGRGWEIGYGRSKLDLSLRQDALNGVASYVVRPQVEQRDLRFLSADHTDLGTWETFYAAVGIHTPFVVVLDHDNRPVDETFYCRFAPGMDMSDLYATSSRISFSIIEAL